jgi:hypothetical protein
MLILELKIDVFSFCEIEVYNETSSDQTAVIHEIDTYKQKKKKQKENFTTEAVT